MRDAARAAGVRFVPLRQVRRDLHPLRDVLGLLRDSYVRTVGTEYMHISDPEQRAWLQERIEVPHQKPSVVEQKYILAN